MGLGSSIQEAVDRIPGVEKIGGSSVVLSVVALLVLVVCVGALVRTTVSGGAGAPSTLLDEYVVCYHPECGAAMTRREWGKLHLDSGFINAPGGRQVLARVCPKCDDVSMVNGIKCPSCGKVVVDPWWWYPDEKDPNFSDRCPKCGARLD